MKVNLPRLVIISIFLLLACTLAYSADDNSSGQPQPENQGILDVLKGMVSNAIVSFFDALEVKTITQINDTYAMVKMFLINNPDITIVKPIHDTIVFILSGFFGLLFTIVGAKFLIGGHSFESRADAKHWLQSIFTLIIVLNLSFLIYQTMLEFGTATSTALWDTNIDSAIDFSNLKDVAGIYTMVFVMATMVVGVSALFLRYILVAFNVVLFPIAIFCYFIPPLKGIGKIFIEFTFGIIIMQIFDVILLIIGFKVVESFLGTAGFFGVGVVMLLLVIVNSVLLVIFVLHGLLSALDSSPTARMVTMKAVLPF